MQDYDTLVKQQDGVEKCQLFDRLKDAIYFGDIDTVKGIFTSKNKYLQEVLGTWILDKNTDGTVNYFTFLTYAIDNNRINVAHTILNTADKDDLKGLLSVKSIIYDLGTEESYTALSFAEEEGRTDLAEKIKAKMEELGLSILITENKVELAKKNIRRTKESLKKDYENLKSLGKVYKDDLDKEFKEKIERLEIEISYMRNELEKSTEKFRESQTELLLAISDASNNLFWAVLRRDGETANNILKNFRTLDSKYLGNEFAQELANKEDKEIIKEIQIRQAVNFAIIGCVSVVLAVAAIATIVLTASEPMTALTITGIVIVGVMGFVGLTVVGFAAFHGLKEIPDTQVEEIGANNPAQLLRE